MLSAKIWLHSIYDIAFSREKLVSSESGERYAQIKYCLQQKTVQNSSKFIIEWISMYLFLRGMLLWIMDFEI